MLSSRDFSCLTKALIVSATAFGLALVTAQTAKAVDFSGKRITFVVPFAEGGGADSWARMMSPYLEKHLPGKPRVLIVNRPGAGGTTGAAYYHERAEKDGTWVFTIGDSLSLAYALGDPRIKFKVQDYHPVLNSPRGITQYFRQDLGLQEVDDLKGKIDKLKSFPAVQLTFGGKTPTSADLGLRVALTLLDVEVNSVWGLGGNGPMAVGFERGEFLLNYNNTLSFLNNRKHMIESGLARPLYTFGNYDAEGNYGRDPALPDVPTFIEFYKAVHGKEPSGPGYEAWKALMGINVPLNKSLVLHPDVPKDVVEAWRAAARAMLEDEEFRTKAKAEFGPYPQIVGEAAVPLRNAALSIPPEAREWLADYVKSRYGLELTSGG